MREGHLTRSGMPRALVLGQLKAILATEPFQRSPTMCKLLSHIVLRTLDGKSQELGGYAIGLDVFARTETFDPGQDSLVRVHMNRLRKLLAAYYAQASHDRTVMIQIPKGSYTASFTPWAEPAECAGEDDPRSPGEVLPSAGASRSKRLLIPGLAAAALLVLVMVLGSWMTGEQPPAGDSRPVMRFMPMTHSLDAGGTTLAQDGTSMLIGAFGKPAYFRVAVATGGGQQPEETDANASLVHVRSHLFNSATGLSLQLSLIKTADREVLWTGIFTQPGETGQSLSQLVRKAAWELHLQAIDALRRLLADKAELRNEPWFLVLNATWSPGAAQDSLAWELERVELARKALSVDPDYMPAHAVLADKLAYLANVDHRLAALGVRQQAMDHARQALSQASTDAAVAGNIANYYWHMGEHDFSTRMATLAASLDPSSPVPHLQSKVHRYTCARAPREVLAFADDFDRSLPPSSPLRWLSLTWLNQLHLNNEDLDQAIDAGQAAFSIFHTPDSALRLATALVANGQLVEADRIVAFLAPNWPNLDLHAYASETMARRCTGQEQGTQIIALYTQMAQQMCIRNPGIAGCTRARPSDRQPS